MVKRIHLVVEDHEYQKLRKLKDRLGLSWEKFFLEAAKCLEKTAKE